jgi:photosystem II stability/assembly factor-like uncharacterized protein
VRPRISPRFYFFLPFFLISAAYAQSSWHVPYTCNESELEFAVAVCSPSEPCTVYVEISSLTRAASRWFAVGNLHTDAATLSSLLMVSDDGGASWKEPFDRQRGKAVDQIQFLDAHYGWAAGETQNPLPRDPFLLATGDGGATWQEYTIGEEGGAGSIVRFHFDSPKHGQLIVDAGRTAEGGRYQLYETETGGTSWTIKSKTDQLPKQAISDAVEDLRVQPAKDGKTLNIELRAGSDWHPGSGISIEAARCAFEPGQLKEPEPEAEPLKAEPPAK